MTEITDLSETDSANTEISTYSVDGNIANMSSTDNVFQSILGLLARSLKSSIWRLRDSTDQTKLLAFDLSGLTTATTRTLTAPDASGTIALTGTTASSNAPRRNRAVNGDKLVSVENQQTPGTTNGRYISDQNAMYFVSSAGTFTGVNVAGHTSPAGGNRDRITITTADASLAAGEYLTYTQNLEGSNVADLKWGTADAEPIVVRRGFKRPEGTWPVAFHNSANNRSYVTTFTVSALEANTDIVREFAIPGDTTGTWLATDGVIGLTMDAVIGAGSTFQGVIGWQGGNILTVSGATNGMALSGAVFEFFDEGLKLDPDATGVYGPYEVGEADAVFRPERYAYSRTGLEIVCSADVLAGQVEVYLFYQHPVQMAKLPSAAKIGTWFVTKVNQPTMSLTSVFGVRLTATLLTTGAVIFYPNTGSLFVSARLT